MSSNVEQEIKYYVETLSDQEIKEIQLISHGLRPLNAKSGETRQTWLDRFVTKPGYENQFKKYASFFSEVLEKVGDATGEKKSMIREELVRQIRTRQEALGLSSYLLNNVKFTTIKILYDYQVNPEKLKTNLPYKARSSSKPMKSKSKTRSPIKSKIDPEQRSKPKKSKSRVIEHDIALTIKVDRYTEKEKENHLVFSLINSNPIPLQNLRIRFLDSDGVDVTILNVLSNHAKTEDNTLIFPFIPSPMEESTTKIPTKILIHRLNTINDKITAFLEFDDTMSKTIGKKTLEILT